MESKNSEQTKNNKESKDENKKKEFEEKANFETIEKEQKLKSPKQKDNNDKNNEIDINKNEKNKDENQELKEEAKINILEKEINKDYIKNNIIDIKEKEEINDENQENNKESKKHILEKQIIEKEKKEENENPNIEKKSYKKELPLKDWGCKTIDNYEIIKEPVGGGSYGTVFKAYYKGPKDYGERIGIPHVVALKKIKTEDEKQGFPITALREIMLMKRLNHKNILQIFEVVVSNKREENNLKSDTYLVFEYMEHDLFSLISSNFYFDKSQIKLIFYQLLQGLNYLHQNNILHRDIKPGNILLNNKGVVKLGDFGLSRIFSEFIKNKHYTNRVVTLWYRCPELLLGETDYGSAVDVWSMGCVFWEIITGEVLFKGKNINEVFFQICKKCGTPTENTWEGISKLKDYNLYIPQKKFDCELDKIYKKYNKFDDTTYDLIKKMICLNPKKRINIQDALKHTYFTSHEPKMCEEKYMTKIEEEFHLNLKYKKDQQKQQQISRVEYKRDKDKKFIGKKRKS